jgi:CheY-like chemotaxis protein
MVEDGEAAVAAAGRGGHDVALLDLELPALGGIAAARRIRAAEQGSGRRLQIVAVTAHASAAARQQSLEAGMDDFLPKPITATRLFESLARAKAAAAMHRAAAGAGADERGVVDWSTALRFCGGQESLLRQVTAAAREQVPALLRESSEAIARHDGDRLRRAAHTLKSTFGYFGAHELRRQAEQLETLAWEGRFDQAATLLERTGPAVSSLLSELAMEPVEPESETIALRRALRREEGEP